MRLSEIAEYIVNNYPDSNIAHNPGIRKGCKEEWYEEFLIEPLLDFYMYEELGLCGSPKSTYEAMRRYLNIRKDWKHERFYGYDDAQAYKEDLCIDTSNNMQQGILQFMMYVLDEHEFTEYGYSINECWLTDNGEMLLTVLEKWHEREYKQYEL